jgi:hypothetical protein
LLELLLGVAVILLFVAVGLLAVAAGEIRSLRRTVGHTGERLVRRLDKILSGAEA